MNEMTPILAYISISMCIGFYLLALLYSRIIKRNSELRSKINNFEEINASLEETIRFQSKVNKTLREGLDAITKKNCHVKNQKTNE